MKLELMNAVVMAEDYEKLRDWYIEALGLELQEEWTDQYHYAELVKDGRLVIGIADAKEMKVEPGEHEQRQDDPAVLGLLVVTPQQIRDAPDEADLFGEVVHGAGSLR